jgi:hypothetical protein
MDAASVFNDADGSGVGEETDRSLREYVFAFTCSIRYVRVLNVSSLALLGCFKYFLRLQRRAVIGDLCLFVMTVTSKLFSPSSVSSLHLTENFVVSMSYVEITYFLSMLRSQFNCTR